MLNASARTLLRPSASAASRRLLSASSKATPAKSSPLAVATDAHHDVAMPSNEERAWCDIYGVDYAKMIEEAQNEAPLALNAPPATGQTDAQQKPAKDIWSVVFGTHAQ